MGRRLQTCEQTRSRDAARFSTSAKTNDTSCVRQSTHVAEPPSSTVATQTALPAHTSSSPLVSSRSFLPSPPTSSAPFHTLARRPGHPRTSPAFARRTSSDMVGRRTVVRALPELHVWSAECSRRWTGAIGISYDSDSYDTRWWFSRVGGSLGRPQCVRRDVAGTAAESLFDVFESHSAAFSTLSILPPFSSTIPPTAMAMGLLLHLR
ncbi:hypothetical protein C8F01DRAFT_1183524 [Mycena amicta]|nr:hypothetical protein C8F01DRAFT_1183524 [Mycena amicta]